MISIAVIDDDINILNELENYVTNYFKNKNFIYKLDKFSCSSNYLESNNTYDVIFLDIELPDKNGIELATTIREIDKECCICFISNYSKYALNTYNVHAFDFIEKPLSQKKINKAFDEIFAYNRLQMSKKKKLSFFTENRKIELFCSEIIYFEYFDSSIDYLNRSTLIYTSDNKYAIKLKISKVFEMLPSDTFCVPHKAFIVNFSNIASIRGNIITMMNGATIPLSQKRAAQFRRKFNAYIRQYLTG